MTDPFELYREVTGRRTLSESNREITPEEAKIMAKFITRELEDNSKELEQ